MSAPKEIRRYTEQWMNLFDKFDEDPTKEHVVHCDTLKQAHTVRLEFYKAREALRHEEALLKESDFAAWEAMAHHSLDKKEVRIVGTDVVFGYKDASIVAQLLARSLAQPSPNVNLKGDSDVEAQASKM